MTEPAADAIVAHCFRSQTPEQTRALAAALALAFREGAANSGLLIALSGGLGVGKTVFVKGLAEGLGVDPQTISSPTFVLANQYPMEGGGVLHHVDLYRLESAAELETLGFFEFSRPGAVVAVEWSDRFPQELPWDRLDLHMERERQATPSDASSADVGVRRIDARAQGTHAASLLDAWRRGTSTGGH